MKKVKAFFYIFRKSLIPEKKYYQHLIKTPFKFSLKYFLILILLLNLILVIYIINLYPYQKIFRLLFNLEKSLETYPPNLTIFIKNNNLFTNNDRPYFHWLEENGKKKLLFSIIETADRQTVNNLYSIITFTKGEVVVKNPTNYQIISTLKHSEIPEMIIHKKLINQVMKILQLLLKNLHWLYLFTVLFLFLISPLISFVITSFYLILGSFLVFSYLKIVKKRHFHFKKVFQISLHAATFPLIIEYLAIFFPVNLFPLKSSLFIYSPVMVPFLILTVFALFTAVGVLKAYNHHQYNHHQK